MLKLNEIHEFIIIFQILSLTLCLDNLLFLNKRVNDQDFFKISYFNSQAKFINAYQFLFYLLNIFC